MKQYKIMHVVGARPHFMKLAPVIEVIREHPELDQVVVHTGQHYDHALSQAFLTEFELAIPDYNLGVGSERHVVQLAQIMMGLDEVILRETPDMIFVYGDTNSTAAGAIAGAKNHLPVGHIEAGLREFDKRIPEEINKLLTDSVADLYFCPTTTGLQNLVKAGQAEKAFNVGDTVIDYLTSKADAKDLDKALTKYHVSSGGYYVLTCHRAANTDNRQKLSAIWDAIHALDLPVIFPAHPRTKDAIGHEGLQMPEQTLVRMVEPTGFWEMQSLLRHARAALTDSGGVIKEAYFHRTPSVILDTQTEWVEVVQEGWATVTGPDTGAILQAIKDISTPSTYNSVLGGGGASERIVALTKEYLNETH